MASEYSVGYKKLWSANNCSIIVKLRGCVPVVVVCATGRIIGIGVLIRYLAGSACEPRVLMVALIVANGA